MKHLACVEAGYLGATFGRPFPEPLPWDDEAAAPDADMWATAQESRADVVALYRRTWAHGDATVAALGLDALGHVAWWGDTGEVTVRQVLVHLIAESHRHAGHADVLRELLDGRAGLRPDSDDLPELDEQQWAAYRERLEQVARQAGGG